MRHIYLDYNATTPIAPSVQESILPFLAEHYGNPSSGHALGRACQEAMEDARGQVAALLGADRGEIVFTSGGTESNNLAIQGVMLRHPPEDGSHLVISAIEHPAITAPARYLQELGYEVSFAPCDDQGVVHPDSIAQLLRDQTRLVSVMHANNEIGTIQPIREIAQLCKSRDILVHTDAAQSAGKIRIHVDELGVDLLTIAGHKIYAPKGVGALYVRPGTAVNPVVRGANHESGLRPGTENVPYIAALGQAASLATRALDESGDRLASLRDRLAKRLADGLQEPLVIHGDKAPRLPNTLSVSFPEVSGHELLRHIPELCASTGSACHSDGTISSPTLAAMGLPAALANGTVRLSVGWYTSEDEVDRAASMLIRAWEDLR